MSEKIPAKLSDLAAAPYNPRRITEPAAAGLAASMAAFGDIAGLTWNVRTGHLVAGHQRAAQLRRRYGDLDLVDGALVAPDGQRWPVRVVDWDEATERAANIAANSPTISGEWTDGLGDLLAQVAEGTPELFGDLRLGELLEEDASPPDPRGDPPPEQIVCPSCGHRWAP
ncbi:MAG: hypothetical protein ABIL09_24025 [Gemmatimonadota bacterium]